MERVCVRYLLVLAAGWQRAELAAHCRCAPGGQRQTGPQWTSSVCPVSFGSQRGLLSSYTPRSPRPWLFVCGPCSLWTRHSLAFHMRLCPITLLTPSEPRESVPISNQLPKMQVGGWGGNTSKTLLLHNRSSFVQIRKFKIIIIIIPKISKSLIFTYKM